MHVSQENEEATEVDICSSNLGGPKTTTEVRNDIPDNLYANVFFIAELEKNLWSSKTIHNSGVSEC